MTGRLISDVISQMFALELDYTQWKRNYRAGRQARTMTSLFAVGFTLTLTWRVSQRFMYVARKLPCAFIRFTSFPYSRVLHLALHGSTRRLIYPFAITPPTVIYNITYNY